MATPRGDVLGWWVGAEDQWHVPAAAPSRRQRLIERAPVVATVIRMPGGDVEHRAYAATIGGHAAVVVEVENQTPTPVAVGFTLRADSPVARDEGEIFAGTQCVLRFTNAPRSEYIGLPESLFVVPLAHRAVVRATLALAGDAPDPLMAPDADAVARGWRSLAGVGVSVTGTAYDDALATARSFLHLHANQLRAMGKGAERATAGAVADALTLMGCDDDAGALRLACRLRPARNGLPLVAPLDTAPGEAGAVDDLTSGAGAAAAARAIYTRLVVDRGDALNLLEGIDLARDRVPIDVHGLPVAGGILGVALRWHGDRPALLWEFEGDVPHRLTASTIDPTWSTIEPKGEALLTPARS